MAHTTGKSGNYVGKGQQEETSPAEPSGHHGGGHEMVSWLLLLWWSGGCFEADKLRDNPRSDQE